MCAQTDSDDADDQYPDEDVDTESYSGSNSGEGDGEEDGEEATASPRPLAPGSPPPGEASVQSLAGAIVAGARANSSEFGGASLSQGNEVIVNEHDPRGDQFKFLAGQLLRTLDLPVTCPT
jgi:hypothetical protein